MLGHKKRKFGAGAGGGAAGAGEAGAAGGTGKKRLGMCAGRTAFNPPFRGKSDAQAGQHGDGGAGGGAASKKQPGAPIPLECHALCRSQDARWAWQFDEFCISLRRTQAPSTFGEGMFM